MNDFTDSGTSGARQEVIALRRQLLANGYAPVRLLNRQKYPTELDWITKAHADLEWCLREDGTHLNTGISTRGLSIIDGDIDDAELSEQIRLLAVRMLGAPLVRVRDNSPRFALIYRGPIRPVTIGNSDGAKLQILSGSTQLMAYGIHPSGVSIAWDQDRGPRECSVAELIEVDADGIMEFLDAVCDILKCERKHRIVPKPKSDQEFFPWTIDDIKLALSFLNEDYYDDYEIWLRVTYAVQSASATSDDDIAEAFEAWDEWSAKSSKYNAKQNHKIWYNISRNPPRSITAGTLVHYVREATGDNNWLPPSWSDFGDGLGPDQESPFEDSADVNDAENTRAVTDNSEPNASGRAKGAKQTLGQLILDDKDPIGSAIEFVKRCYQSDDIATLHHLRGEFYRWQGNCYRPWPKENLYAQLNLWLDSGKQRLTTGYRPFRPNQKKVGEVLKALTSIRQLDADLAEPAWLVETNYPVDGLLACRNALLHLPTMEQLPHSPELFNINALEFDYDAKAACPQWIELLGKLWPMDMQCIHALQEIFGLCLTNDTSFHKIFMLIGPPRSGKGTIARILIALLGAVNTCSPTLNGLAGRFGLEGLIGKLLAVFPDVRLDKKTSKGIISERLLSVSGADRLSIERKNKIDWNGTLATRIMMLCNELPILSDISGALPSRFVMLQLTQSFLGKEDRMLTGKLLTELPGILNWSIAGWKRLMERGHFVAPDTSERIRKTFEQTSSPLKAFIEAYCAFGEGYEIAKTRLFEAYAVHRCRVGLKSAAYSWFGRNMNAAYPSLNEGLRGPKGVQVPHYVGMKLTGEGEKLADDYEKLHREGLI